MLKTIKLILIVLSVANPIFASSNNVQKMFHGLALEDDHPGRYSAVAIKSDNIHYEVCSGVLVAESLVVTAAHCVYNRNFFDLRQTEISPSYIHFTSHAKHTPSSHIRKIAKIAIHPQYNPDQNQTLFDIAWIQFEGQIPAPYHPIPVLGRMNQIVKKQKLFYVGFGLTEVFAFNQQLYSEGVFLNYYDETTQWPGIITSTIAKDGSGPCWGDSGGPLYAKINHIWTVVGVLNGSTKIENQDDLDRCGNGDNAHNSLPYFRSWIEQSSGMTFDYVLN